MTKSIEGYRLDRIDEIINLKSSQIDDLYKLFDRLEDRLQEIEVEKKVKTELKSTFKTILYYIQSLSPFVLVLIIVICSIDIQKLSTKIKQYDHLPIVQSHET